MLLYFPNVAIVPMLVNRLKSHASILKNPSPRTSLRVALCPA